MRGAPRGVSPGELPDYIPGKPPWTEILEDFSYLNELPRIRGKHWGSQGIGRLREVALVCPTEHEQSPP